MEKYIEILKNCPLFKDIEDKNILRLLKCLNAKVSFFDKKYTVFTEGTKAKYIGIVLSGAVQTEFTDYYGNRSIFNISNQGETFCEAFSCAGTESLPVCAVASKPSEIMFIDSSHILHTCSSSCGFHSQLIFNLMRNIAEKNVELHRRTEINSGRTTREKLLTYLSMQAKKENSNSFYIPFNRQELADYLEADRSGLSSEIGKLIKEGIISSKKNYFELH